MKVGTAFPSDQHFICQCVGVYMNDRWGNDMLFVFFMDVPS